MKEPFLPLWVEQAGLCHENQLLLRDCVVFLLLPIQAAWEVDGITVPTAWGNPRQIPAPQGAGVCHGCFRCGVQIPVFISLLLGIECLDCCFGPFYPGGEVISASLFSGVIWKHPCSPGSSLASSMTWCWLRAEPCLVPRHERRENTTKVSWVEIRNGRDKEWER